MFREASVYALRKLGPEQKAAYGLRVLTMRWWPRGISRQEVDMWIPSAAPSVQTLQAYREGRLSWPQFIEAYQAEQRGQALCQVISYLGGVPQQVRFPSRAIDHLRSLEQRYGTVTVLCWEQGKWCHRHVLKAMLESGVRA